MEGVTVTGISSSWDILHKNSKSQPLVPFQRWHHTFCLKPDVGNSSRKICGGSSYIPNLGRWTSRRQNCNDCTTQIACFANANVTWHYYFYTVENAYCNKKQKGSWRLLGLRTPSSLNETTSIRLYTVDFTKSGPFRTSVHWDPACHWLNQSGIGEDKVFTPNLTELRRNGTLADQERCFPTCYVRMLTK